MLTLVTVKENTGKVRKEVKEIMGLKMGNTANMIQWSKNNSEDN